MEWPDYLQRLATAFDFPGFEVKEKFEWEKLPKDIKSLIFEHLKNMEEDILYKRENLRLVNKEFYSNFYKNKPNSCIKYSFEYHYEFKNLSKLLLSKITPNQLKNFDYPNTLFYHLLNYYFTLDNPNFHLFFIKNINCGWPNEEKDVVMIMDYFKSINIELKDLFLDNCIRILLCSDDIDWIENHFSPKFILDKCIQFGNCGLFYQICKKYNINPDINFLKRALLATATNINCEKILKLYDSNLYVKLIFEIYNNSLMIDYRKRRTIINSIFKLLKYVSDEDFQTLLTRFGSYESFFNNENLWHLFIKFKDKIFPEKYIFFMTKNLIPFDFNYILKNIGSISGYLFYIGKFCNKEELIFLKNSKYVRNAEDYYYIYYYIKTRFPEIYEEEFLSGVFNIRYNFMKSDLLDFPFINKEAIADKIAKYGYHLKDIPDDELFYLYSLKQNYPDNSSVRFIRQCIIHENMKKLYDIFSFYKKSNEVEELMKIINSCLDKNSYLTEQKLM